MVVRAPLVLRAIQNSAKAQIENAILGLKLTLAVWDPTSDPANSILENKEKIDL